MTHAQEDRDEVDLNIPSQDELTADDEEAPYYVITKGKTENDVGIYRSWAEVQPRIHGVPGANHKRLYTLEQAQSYFMDADTTKTNHPAEQTKQNLRRR